MLHYAHVHNYKLNTSNALFFKILDQKIKYELNMRCWTYTQLFLLVHSTILFATNDTWNVIF